MASKEPISENLPDYLLAAIAAGPKTSHPPNVASADGVDYDITGPEREDFLADFLELMKAETDTASKDAFAAKWAHLKTILPPLTGESST
jgi:hypothetical protein